ncbi:MAG TPA: hypothetical protein VEL69_07795, partial [Ktedonobacteraceae bacterium]|nr:hypothetical protein [Ktedonobacteraceae bacterium]
IHSRNAAQGRFIKMSQTDANGCPETVEPTATLATGRSLPSLAKISANIPSHGICISVVG